MKAEINENGILCLGIESDADNAVLMKYCKDNEGMIIIDNDRSKPMYVKLKGLKILIYKACESLNYHI